MAVGRERVDVLLVCSPGGHALQLHALAGAWAGRRRVWVTLDKPDVRSLLAEEPVVFAHGPTNRNVLNLVRNLWLALRVIHRCRPAAIVTTGAALAVPFGWIGRLYGARVVYVETVTRFDSVSLACRLIHPVASRIYVQWEDLVPLVRGARFAGAVFSE